MRGQVLSAHTDLGLPGCLGSPKFPFPNLPGVGSVKKLEMTLKENINHGVEVRALEKKAVPESYMNKPRKPVST